MKTHKKVTYTLQEKTLLEIEIILLMKSVESNVVKTTKSSIVKDCLLSSYKLFEQELVENGGLPLSETYNLPNKFSNTQPITITLPFEVVDRLDYFSKKLGIKKSHLVMCSLFLSGK